jgi:hypothetical protein
MKPGTLKAAGGGTTGPLEYWDHSPCRGQWGSQIARPLQALILWAEGRACWHESSPHSNRGNLFLGTNIRSSAKVAGRVGLHSVATHLHIPENSLAENST